MDVDETGSNVIAVCVDDLYIGGNRFYKTDDFSAVAVKHKSLAAYDRLAGKGGSHGEQR